MMAAVQLCNWLGTAVYFRVSGTRQHSVTPQQWRLLVTSTISFSFLLIVVYCQIYFWATGDNTQVGGVEAEMTAVGIVAAVTDGLSRARASRSRREGGLPTYSRK